jgi:flagellar biosynthesis/type III secretory pathway protein FliH
MSSDAADRTWVLRGQSPAALLVPRVEPPPTRDDVDAAYEQGLEEGLRRAAAERAHAVHELQRAAQAARADLATHIESMRARTTSLSVDLATELTRWLLDEAIELDPTRLRGRIDLALDAIADERDARFVVAPCMVDLVRSWLGTDTEVEGDPQLHPGELRIEAGHARLDATYDVALARARRALVASFERLDVREPA